MINVGTAFTLGLLNKQNGHHHWMYYVSNAYISTQTYTSTLMKAFQWSTTDGKASWTVKRTISDRKLAN